MTKKKKKPCYLLSPSIWGHNFWSILFLIFWGLYMQTFYPFEKIPEGQREKFMFIFQFVSVTSFSISIPYKSVAIPKLDLFAIWELTSEPSVTSSWCHFPHCQQMVSLFYGWVTSSIHLGWTHA